jgi:predicted  nucleic acid-binding Zn-ribbon protein
MDQDLIDYLEQRFSSIDRRFDQVDQRFETLETEVRRAYVAIEDLRGQVRLVADGVTNVSEQLSQHREEVSQRFDEVESFNRRSYEDLDSRVRKLKATG